MAQVESPIKISSAQYYVHKSYVNSYYYVYIFLEDWISNKIFREDVSRIFMSSPEYSFRRRFELTDMSQSYDEIEASSLRFPFASYWPQNSGWINDDRIAANTAAQLYLGLYVGNTRLQTASVIHKIPVTFYFDREDDARMAYSNLFFYTYNHHHYETKVPHVGNSLKIPIILDINNLVFNPTFKESDWLQKNRVFVITAEFECRTYIVKPPAQPRYDINVNGDGYLSDGSGIYDDGYSKYYIVDDVILNLTNQNWKLETYEGVNKGFPVKGEAGVIYTDSYVKEHGENIAPQMYVWMNNWIDSEHPEPRDTYVPINSRYLSTALSVEELSAEGDAIRYDGLLEEAEIKFKRFGQESSTFDSVTVSWEFEENVSYIDYEETLSSLDYFKYKIPRNYSIVKFYINGEESQNYKIENRNFSSKEKLPKDTVCKVRYYLLEKIGVYTENGTTETFLASDVTSYIITNLTPGCSYLIYVNFYMVNGITKKLGCTIKTSYDEAYYKKKNVGTNQLIGISW